MTSSNMAQTETRYIAVGEDISGNHICYRDEQGLPVTFATEQEAIRDVAEDMVEFWQQVVSGERTIDEVPYADDVYPCTVNADGSVTLEDGTIIPATQD